MTADAPILLPPGSTTFERAAEQASASRWRGLDAGLVSRSKDPATCPEHLLDFLAYELSVDVWNDAWAVERKRWAIANAIRLHRLKGTEAGIRAHLELAGAQLVRAVVPPAKSFLVQTKTAADRARFLARYPQLRIYPFAERLESASGVFLGSGSSSRFFGRMFPERSRSQSRYRREARLYEPRTGEETVLTRRIVRREAAYAGTVYDHEEVVLPAAKRGSYVGDRPAAASYFCVTDAPKRTYTVRVGRPYEAAIGKVDYVTVVPGLDPINQVPELVREHGARHGGSFIGEPFHRRFLVGSRAWQRLYERFWLLDPTRDVSDLRGPMGSYLGTTRFGMPAHNAELKIAVRGRRTRRAFGRYMHGHLLRHDPAPLDAAKAAVRSSKRLSDRILLDTRTRRPARASDPIDIETYRLGQYVKD